MISPRLWAVKVMLHTLALALIVFLGLMAVLFFAQRRLIFPASHDMYRTPADKPYNLPFEDLYLPVPGGYVTNVWYLPSDQAEFTVLFSKGNGGTLADWLDVLLLFHEMKLNILMYDYGGYGRSTGSPSEKRLYEDGQAVWQYLTETRGIPANRIVLIGHSIGGGVASQLASECKPAALVLQSTFTSMAQVAQDHVPWLPVKYLLLDRFDTAFRLPRVTCPVLVVHSPDDKLVPFAHARKLFDLAPQPKQFLKIRGDHNDGIAQSQRLYTETLRNFLDGLPR